MRLNATFAPSTPVAGNVGFLSQSGALGLAFIDLAADRSLGLSSFASIGNRADITGNDLLEYWETDPETGVALLYIESFSDPRRFSRVARRVGRKKPIAVVKSGRSQAGARATTSHTGALLAASDVTVDALFEQAGVTRTDTLAELLDVASLLSNQPLPKGPRVAIITNAGGPGIMCADACEAAGLEVPPLPEEVPGELARLSRARGGRRQPRRHDRDGHRRAVPPGDRDDGRVGWGGRADRHLRQAAADEAEDVAAAVGSAVAEISRELPVQAVFMSQRDHAAMAAGATSPPISTRRMPRERWRE